METKRENHGFTVLELIIVIIIVGVLAGLALPRLYNTIEGSRAVEAMNAMGVLRRALERNYHYKGTYNDTGSPLNQIMLSTFMGENRLDVNDPGGVPGSHFDYSVMAGNNYYSVLACRNNLDGGQPNHIFMAFGRRQIGGCGGAPAVWAGTNGVPVVDWNATGPYIGMVPK